MLLSPTFHRESRSVSITSSQAWVSASISSQLSLFILILLPTTTPHSPCSLPLPVSSHLLSVNLLVALSFCVSSANGGADLELFSIACCAFEREVLCYFLYRDRIRSSSVSDCDQVVCWIRLLVGVCNFEILEHSYQKHETMIVKKTLLCYLIWQLPRL